MVVLTIYHVSIPLAQKVVKALFSALHCPSFGRYPHIDGLQQPLSRGKCDRWWLEIGPVQIIEPETGVVASMLLY